MKKIKMLPPDEYRTVVLMTVPAFSHVPSTVLRNLREAGVSLAPDDYEQVRKCYPGTEFQRMHVMPDISHRSPALAYLNTRIRPLQPRLAPSEEEPNKI